MIHGAGIKFCARRFVHGHGLAGQHRFVHGGSALQDLAVGLRLAVIFCRSRRTIKPPKMKLEHKPKGYRLEVERGWLEHNTLVAHALEGERHEWDSVGVSFEFSEKE